MANFVLRSSRRAILSPGFRPQFNQRNVIPRNIATIQTASGDAANLPLAEIKVLDMTRVLAGVSRVVFCDMDEAYSEKALLHSNLRRPWVRDGQPCTDQHPRLAKNVTDH
jgi:hypothetical protein